jgi:hypothetical protein
MPLTNRSDRGGPKTYGSGFGSATLPIISRNLRKTFLSIVARLLIDFLSLKPDVNVHTKRNKQKNYLENFVGILETTDEKSRIRIQIVIQFTDLRIRTRLKMLRIRNTG